MRYDRYLCSLCECLKREGIADVKHGTVVCPQCQEDHADLVLLYNEIVKARPHYSNLTINQLFRKMWQSVQTSTVQRVSPSK